MAAILAAHGAQAAPLTFEDTKRADPDGKGQLTSVRLIFHNIGVEGNQDFTKMAYQATGLGVSYFREGREFGLSAYGSAALALSVDQNKASIPKSRAYMIEGGADLNYILLNANRWFLGAGVAGHLQLGGITVDQLNTDGNAPVKLGVVPFTALLGLDARVRYYGFQELFFTGYASWAFLPVHSKELQGRVDPLTSSGDLMLQPVDAESPSLLMVEGTAEYRPVPTIAFHAGLRVKVLSYKSTDLSTSASTTKTFSSFVPFIGITYLY